MASPGAVEYAGCGLARASDGDEFRRSADAGTCGAAESRAGLLGREQDVAARTLRRSEGRTSPWARLLHRPTLAPGTSNRRAARRDYGNAFTLSYPDALNGRSSTFFLGLRRFVPPHRFSRFIGRIHEDDLHRLNEALGPESEERHGAN